MKVKLTHTCPSCNGALSIDHKIDKYICCKCRALYELDHFGTDSLRDLGIDALARRDFNTARRKFEEVLDQEPGSFDALRAILCSDLQIQNLNEITDVEKLASYTRIPKLSTLKEMASEEDKEFFDKFTGAYEDSKSYMAMAAEYNTSLSEAKTLYGQTVQLESSLNRRLKPVKLDLQDYTPDNRDAVFAFLDIFSTSDPDDVRDLILVTIGVIGWGILAFILGMNFANGGIIAILVTVVYFIAVFTYMYFQHKKKKERLLPELNSARERWSKMDADLKETRKKIESFRDDIAQRCSELADYKR